jgi:hypothetical protein
VVVIIKEYFCTFFYTTLVYSVRHSLISNAKNTYSIRHNLFVQKNLSFSHWWSHKVFNVENVKLLKDLLRHFLLHYPITICRQFLLQKNFTCISYVISEKPTKWKSKLRGNDYSELWFFLHFLTRKCTVCTGNFSTCLKVLSDEN